MEALPKPDTSYLIDVGVSINAGKDREAKRLLREAAVAWDRCNGTNFRDNDYRNAERRLREYLFGKVLKENNCIVPQGGD